jgi:hypothetical protein
MNARMTIKFNYQEITALEKCAAEDMRDLREQARYIICKELERRGLLPEKQDQSTQATPVKNE